jgi:hypothetical protein
MKNPVNAWDGPQENRGDFYSSEIAGGKDEHSRVAGSQCRDLQRTISQSLILGEDDPASLTDRPKPNAVFLVASEMVVVNLDDET